MKGHEAVARALADCGVSTVFGLVGDANLLYVSSYVEHGLGRFVGAVDERGAASMADGYARVTGGLGVVSVTHGPAAANILNPVVEASRAHTPLLVLTGDTPAHMRGHPQRIDLSQLFAATGAQMVRARSADTLVDEIESAISYAVQASGPVVLDLPVDLMLAELTYRRRGLCRTDRQAIGPDEDALDRALGIIASAKRPVLVAGRGAVLAGAREVLLELAERLDAPVVATGSGKDIFFAHRLDLGIMGGMSPDWVIDILSSADCIVAFGAGLNDFTTSNGDLLAGKAVVHCDTDPTRIGRHGPVTSAVVGDVRITAHRFLDAFAELDAPGSGFATRHPRLASAERRPAEEFADRSSADLLDPRTAMVVAEECLPRDKAVVTDGGRFKVAPWRYLHVEDPFHFVQAGAWASIGLGIGTAIGASVAMPERRTVCVTGDGGGMMGLIEMTTAVRLGLPLTLVVLNDSTYGAEHAKYVANGFDPTLSHTAWPELSDLCAAMGVVSRSARTADQLRKTLVELADVDGPVMVDVKTDRQIDPLVP